MSRFPTAEERWPRQGEALPKWSKKTICPLPFMAIHGDGPNLYSPCCYNKNPAFKKYKTITITNWIYSQYFLYDVQSWCKQ